MGMGYPQDMFAEHITIKASVTKTAKVVKSNQEKCSPATKSTDRENTNKAAYPSAVGQPVQSASLMQDFNLRRLNVIAIHVFDLSTDKVAEQAVTSEAFLSEQPRNLPFSQLFVRFRNRILACLPGQPD